MARLAHLAIGGATLLALTGCVRRTITITSEPPGALVWVNDQEVGRTPVEVDFLYYGTYDVRLDRDGYEPLQTSGRAEPPWWDLPVLDLAAEAMPGDPHARVHWHYVLEPADTDPDALLGRARELRATVVEAGSDGTESGGVTADDTSEGGP